MSDLIKSGILGIIQGITEFLPVSSTGHLIIIEIFLGISQSKFGLGFDAALHMGTLVALLLFFKKEWQQLFISGIEIIKKRQIRSDSEKLVILLIIGTIPGMIFGLLLEKKIETVFRSPILVALMLIVFSSVLIYVEITGKKARSIHSMNRWESVKVGLAQSLALIPGVSRSGITMATGMWEGLTREEASRFAFLLSAPIIAGAGGLKLVKTLLLFLHGSLTISDLLFFITGIVTAAIFGYLTIKYFLRYISKNSLYPFIIYRIALGLVLLILGFLKF